MTVVLDTNVLLAGMATHGLCASLLALCLRDRMVVLSEHILGEFAEHYQSKFKASPEQTTLATEMLRSNAMMVVPAELPPDAFSDADDLPVLGTAVAAKAACLMTGDAALLELGSFGLVAILSPRASYDVLRRP